MDLVPPHLRTGLVGEHAGAPLKDAEIAIGLLRVFSKEACDVAGKYVHGHGRSVVRAGDMRAALMYCARTFFTNTEEEDLRSRLRCEMEEMGEEEDDEEDDDEEDDEDDEEEDDEDDEEEDDEEDCDTRDATEEERRFSRNVDTVVDTWSLWRPTDPVHCLIKKAIDAT